MKKADRNYWVSAGVAMVTIIVGAMLTAYTRDIIYLGLLLPFGVILSTIIY